MKALSPILFILIAILGFFFFIKPEYAEVKILRVEASKAQETLNKVNRAQAKNNELVTTLNSLNTKDLDDLQKLLPDSIDTLRLIVDLSHLTDQYKTEMENISFQSVNAGATAEKAKGGAALHDSTMIRFNVTLGYREFISFMKDLERSLRIIDISSVSFKPTASGAYTYTVSVKTYWLK